VGIDKSPGLVVKGASPNNRGLKKNSDLLLSLRGNEEGAKKISPWREQRVAFFKRNGP